MVHGFGVLSIRMVCRTVCMAMRFEWNGEKNRINKRKHDGLAFETAGVVFTITLRFSEKIAFWRANSVGTLQDTLAERRIYH